VTVTAAEIAIALGSTPPESGGPDDLQWAMWINDALMLIEARLGDPALLNQDRLDYVVREAVVAQVRRPDDATSVEIAVDDGRVARRYSSSRGRVYIRDEWWALLDPNPASSGAFAIDTMPTTGLIHADICALNFGATYCSCGAILTGSYPLWEIGL
jgi:hypothetical protein